MNKSEIQKVLHQNYTSFVDSVKNMSEGEAMKSAEGKWSPARLLDHLIKSVRPVKLAFSLPTFILSLFFGRANRPSRNYAELIDRYHSKLASGGKASRPFIPDQINELSPLYRKMERSIHTLNRLIDNFSEADLDRLILPHPLLGKLTLREMLYFTAYHAQHHGNQIDPHNKYAPAKDHEI